jgi:hypothetical protein
MMGMHRTVAALCAAGFLAGCSGAAPNGSPLPGGHPASAGSAFGDTPRRSQAKLTLTIPPRQSERGKHPGFISPGTQSVVVIVNAGKPQVFNTTLGSPNCTGSSAVRRPRKIGLTCSFLVTVPYGKDTFVVNTFSNAKGRGAILDRGNAVVTIDPGSTSPVSITLDGVPASLVIGGLPPGTAGTAFPAPQSFIVSVKDADSNVIIGTYTTPISLTDGDANGATTIATAGSDNPPAGELRSSSDTVTLDYTGLAIVPATIRATAAGATSGTRSFAPKLQPPTLSAGCAQTTDACADGTSSAPGSVQFTTVGDTANLTPGEIGWTNAPYFRKFVLKSDTCNLADDPSAGGNWATLSPAAGQSAASFALTAQNAGTNGDPATCVAVFADGTGQTVSVNVEVTLGQIGIH